MKVGFVGLGIMGYQIVGKLVEAKHQVATILQLCHSPPCAMSLAAIRFM